MLELLADPTVIAVGGTVLGGFGVKKFVNREPKERFTENGYRIGYSAHYTRQLEIQEFGYPYTQCYCQYCEDQLRIENENAKALNRKIQEAEREAEWERKRLAQSTTILAGDYTRTATIWCKHCKATCRKEGSYALSSGLWSCENCYQRYHKTQKCSRCKVPLDYDGWCSNGCVKEYRDSLRPVKRERMIEGYRVPIPDDVPDYAHATLMHNPEMICDEVMWRWTDESTGYQCGRRQIVADIFDPDTDDYLGTYYDVTLEERRKAIYRYRSVP